MHSMYKTTIEGATGVGLGQLNERSRIAQTVQVPVANDDRLPTTLSTGTSAVSVSRVGRALRIRHFAYVTSRNWSTTREGVVGVEKNSQQMALG
jgi:hypothetical protein